MRMLHAMAADDAHVAVGTADRLLALATSAKAQIYGGSDKLLDWDKLLVWDIFS